MKLPNPPFIATILLEWMGPRDEALAGDLLEGHRSGRSRIWYWQQVMAAILIGAAAVVRAHKLVAARALAVGWIVGFVYFQYVAAWVSSAVYTALTFDEFLFAAGLTKWFYLNHVGFPDAFLRVVGPVTLCLGWLVNGWTVGHLHRAHGPSIVVAYVTVFSGAWLLQLAWLLLLRGADPGAIVTLGTDAFLQGSMPVLIGGLWGARRLPAKLPSAVRRTAIRSRETP